MNGQSIVGDVYAIFEIWANDGSYLRNLRMKADTGVTYSQLPATLLRDMGWMPTRAPGTFVLANGSHVTSDLGMIRGRYNQMDFDELFVFGEDDCLPVIGVEALQNLGLGVDTVNHRLIHIELDVDVS